MKQSERLLERIMCIHQEQLNGYALSTSGGGDPNEAHRAILVAHAVRRATGEALDEEHERREALESDVLERLSKLERKTSCTELVDLHEEGLEVTPGIRQGRMLRVLFGQHEPTPAQRKLADSAASTVAANPHLLGAYPCSERMPDPELRVLAFVPSQPEGRRWRMAQWCAPPAQYTDAGWRDEETLVGDVRIWWRPEQVTHWMPLPGEPA